MGIFVNMQFDQLKPKAAPMHCISFIPFLPTKAAWENYMPLKIIFKGQIQGVSKKRLWTLETSRLSIGLEISPKQGVTNIRIFEYIRIFSDTNIRSYHIRIIFLMRIYSDIRSYCFFDTNIFGYSFVSFF